MEHHYHFQNDIDLEPDSSDSDSGPTEQSHSKRKEMVELLEKTTDVEEVLSVVLQNELLEGGPDAILASTNAILKCAFGTIDVIKMIKRVYKDDNYNPGPCREIIEESSKFSYSCLDCQTNSNCLICISCFENSSHMGHR